MRRDIAKLEARVGQLRLDLGRVSDGEAEPIARILAATLSELAKKKQLLAAVSKDSSGGAVRPSTKKLLSGPPPPSGFEIDPETKALISNSFKRNAKREYSNLSSRRDLNPSRREPNVSGRDPNASRRDYTDALTRNMQNLAMFKAKNPNYRRNATTLGYTPPPQDGYAAPTHTYNPPTIQNRRESTPLGFTTPLKRKTVVTNSLCVHF